MTTDWLFTAAGKAFLLREYVAAERSTYSVAVERGTYANLVRRALMHHGIQPRDRSSAQLAALGSGRAVRPCAGPRDPGVAERIAASMASFWAEMGEAARGERSRLGREAWAAMTEGERVRLRDSARSALSRAARHGSRVERFLGDGLAAAGYAVERRASVGGVRVDLLLREGLVGVDVRGPSHFLPLFGEEELARVQAADVDREVRLREIGYRTVVVGCEDGSKSRAALDRLLRELVEMGVNP